MFDWGFACNLMRIDQIAASDVKMFNRERL